MRCGWCQNLDGLIFFWGVLKMEMVDSVIYDTAYYGLLFVDFVNLLLFI